MKKIIDSSAGCRELFQGKTAALHNLGCKVNQYETDAMKEALVQAGFTIVPFESPADVYVINTCSVTNIADRKSRQMLHRCRKFNPEGIVVAAGCYVQTAKVKTGNEVDADILIGNGEKGRLVELLAEYFSQHAGDAAFPAGSRSAGDERLQTEKASAACAPAAQAARAGHAPEAVDAGGSAFSAVADLRRVRSFEDMTLTEIHGHTRADIKVQDGCNMYCSYCIIPYARGHVRSRSMESIIDELTALADSGIREVVLTGIHLSSYGVDFPDTDASEDSEQSARPELNELYAEYLAGRTGSMAQADEEADRSSVSTIANCHARQSWQERSKLVDLVERVAEIDGIERIRLGSLEPTIITEENAERLSRVKKLCPHFHLSLQSGSDSVLRRMNRHYDTEDYLRRCEILRKYFDRPAITTDIIVGFPQETEEELQETVDFLGRVHFYETHIFKYSLRAGTRAAAMPGQITERVKAERSDVLEEINLINKKAYEDSWADGRSEVEVLFEDCEEIGGRRFWTGLTKEYVRVYSDSEKQLAGEICRGKVVREDGLLCFVTQGYEGVS